MKKIILLTTVFFYCLEVSYAQPGELDSSFGVNGIVKSDIAADSIYHYPTSASQVLLLNDGSMYIIIEAANASSYIAKRNPNGSPDLSFGNNGFSVSASFPMYMAHAVIQSDGKIILAGTSNGKFEDFGLVRYNTNGSIDKTFSGDGKVTTDFGSTTDFANSLALQSDGKIIVAGYAYTSSNSTSKFAIARYNTDGSLDTTFSGDGMQTDDFGFPNAYAHSVLIQDDGKIIVAGNAFGTTSHKNLISRYNKDGTPDKTFGNDGILATNFYLSLASQKDGKIIGVSGNSQGDFVLVRYSRDGSPDDSFSGDGNQTTDFGGTEFAQSLFVQDDGKIVVAGYTTGSDGSGNKLAIARYDTSGNLDNNFSTDGKQITDFGTDIQGTSVAAESDGKIICIGGFYADFVVARYNTGGSLDHTFDGDGKLTFTYSIKKPGLTYYSGSSVQSDGKIVVAGEAWNGVDYDNIIIRYNTDGRPDSTFDSDGIQKTHTQSLSNAATSVAIQSDGKIVSGGSENGDFAIIRYNTDGSLDKTLSGDGKQTTHIGSLSGASSVAIQSNAKIIAAGSTGGPGGSDIALVRYNADGSLDKSFSGDGIQITDIGTNDVAKDVAVQKDGKIVVGGYTRNNKNENNSDFVIVRYNTDGSLDKSFSGDGIQTYDLHVANDDENYHTDDVIISLVIQEDGKIVVAGGRYDPNRGQSYVVARYNINGSIDSTFGGSGIFSYGAFDGASSVAIQSDGKIIVAGGEGFALARYNQDGSIDNTFSEDGIVKTDVSEGSSGISSIAIFKDKLYAVGIGNFEMPQGVVTRYLPDSKNPNKPPLITFTNPNDNASYSAPGTIILSVDANDEDGIVKKVDFYNGSTLLHTAEGSPYTFNWINVPKGQYSVTAIATDGVGLIASAIVHVSVKANTPPVIRITSPVDNQSFGEHARFFLSADVSDDGKISRVDFYLGKSLLSSAYPPYKIQLSISPIGNYTFTAKATDNGGLVTISDAVHIFIIKNQPPAVTLTLPVNNAVYTGPATFYLSASPYDKDGTISQVEFYDGSKLLNTQYAAPYGYTYYNVPVGNHILTAKAYDNSGGAATSAAVSVSVVTNKPPSISLTAPSNNASYAGPASVYIKATASDEDGSIENVSFYNGTTLLRIKSVIPYGYLWRDVPVGNYTITAKATDNSGAIASASINVSVVASTSPTVTILYPLDNAEYTEHSSIIIHANASDPNAAIQRVEFYNGTTLLHTEFISSYSYVWENVPKGSYTLTAKSINDNGIVTTSNSVHVSVVTNKPPGVSIKSPSNSQSFEMPANIPLTADAKDDDGYISKVDFYLNGSLIVTEYSYPYSIVWKNVNLIPGNYILVAKATDNSGAIAISQSVTIQLVGPGGILPTSKVSSSDNKDFLRAITNKTDLVNEPSGLKLSPNPVQNTLYISINGQQDKTSELYVLSASGVVLKNMHSLSSNEIPLDISSLVNGVYFIKIITGDKVMYKPFVKL